MTKLLEGVQVLTITPLKKDYSLNEDAIYQQVEWLVKQGVQGIWVTGYLGEGNVLDEDVLKIAHKLFLEAAKGRLYCGAGCPSNNPLKIVRLVNNAEKLGYDMAWFPPPFPRRPSDDEIFDFYKYVHDRTHLPLGYYSTWAYNIYMHPTVIQKLGELERIICGKEVISDFDHMALLYKLGCYKRLKLFPTHAQVWAFQLGAAGTTCSPHIVPEMVQMWSAWKSGDAQKALMINVDAHGFLLAHPATAAIAFASKIDQSTQGWSKALCSATMRIELGPPMAPYRPVTEEQNKALWDAVARKEHPSYHPPQKK